MWKVKAPFCFFISVYLMSIQLCILTYSECECSAFKIATSIQMIWASIHGEIDRPSCFDNDEKQCFKVVCNYHVYFCWKYALNFGEKCGTFDFSESLSTSVNYFLLTFVSKAVEFPSQKFVILLHLPVIMNENELIILPLN